MTFRLSGGCSNLLSYHCLIIVSHLRVIVKGFLKLFFEVFKVLCLLGLLAPS